MRPRHRPPLIALAGAVLAVAAAPGCGYAVGYDPVAKGISTVAVEVVDNLSFRQRFERELTRSIARQISEYSGYRHAPRSRADAILSVEIVAVRNTTLVYGVTKPTREGSLDTIVRIRLIERRSGEVLVDTRRRDIAEYRILIGEGSASAQAEMVADLGRAIVLALEPGF